MHLTASQRRTRYTYVTQLRVLMLSMPSATNARLSKLSKTPRTYASYRARGAFTKLSVVRIELYYDASVRRYLRKPLLSNRPNFDQLPLPQVVHLAYLLHHPLVSFLACFELVKPSFGPELYFADHVCGLAFG